MSDQANASIAKHEESAMKAAADENLKELKKDSEEDIDDNDSDDEVIKPRFKPVSSLDEAKSNSNTNTKKEAPEMNMQLQR